MVKGNFTIGDENLLKLNIVIARGGGVSLSCWFHRYAPRGNLRFTTGGNSITLLHSLQAYFVGKPKLLLWQNLMLKLPKN